MKIRDSRTRSPQISKKKLATLVEELIKAHIPLRKTEDCQDEAFSHEHWESLENYNTDRNSESIQGK